VPGWCNTNGSPWVSKLVEWVEHGETHLPVRGRKRWVSQRLNPSWGLWTLLNRIAPAYATTTEQVGCAMIKVARHGYNKPILESEDINAV
jgi:hypothetical protein